MSSQCEHDKCLSKFCPYCGELLLQDGSIGILRSMRNRYQGMVPSYKKKLAPGFITNVWDSDLNTTTRGPLDDRMRRQEQNALDRILGKIKALDEAILALQEQEVRREQSP